MEQFEIEPYVSELETRVERLRSLYDQYFMGIERLEPLVPKKDVERRLAILRKEQIRNTGLRFRFQMIVQRYNTYTTYWMRTARQIELGTFKRHVMRATAKFGVDPTKERPSESLVPASLASSPASGSMPSSAPYIELPDAPIEEVYDLSAIPEEEDDPFAPIAPPRTPERFVSGAKLELDDGADPFEEVDPFPKPAQKQAGKIRVAPRSQGTPASPVPLDTERRIPVAPQSAPLATTRGVGGPPRIDTPTAQNAVRAPLAPPPRMTAQIGPNAPRADVARRPATLPSAGARIVPTSPGGPRVAPAPPSSPRAVPPTETAQATATTTGTRPALRRASPADAANAAPIPGSPAKTTPAFATKPAFAPASVAKPAPAPAARPAAASPVGDLSGDRFGEIYSKYVETRRKQNEPTHAITREALAKQLDESTTRLKQKSGGKAIDFEVVVKDGRTILRPIVK